MRTTVNIDDHLLEWAKSIARGRQLTLGAVIDEALQRHCSDPLGAAEPELPVFQGPDLGMQAGIDPNSNRAMLDAADDLTDLHA